jgi:hypothetical protein
LSALLSQLYIPHHIPEAESSHPQLEEHSLTSLVAPSVSGWREQLASVSFYQYSDDVNVIEAVEHALEGDVLDYEGIVGIVIENRVMVIKVEEMAYLQLDLVRYIPGVIEQGIVGRVGME